MDIRQQFLDFFASKSHEVVQSSPLVPDDATLLFTNAGMVQFKNIFTGTAPIPQNPRATSSQTCIRAGGKHNDLDNVGYTARHHTFFEMLGNFSFGDYFKKDAIAYAWEFITSNEYLGLPVDKIWVTVHDSDDEAFEIWSNHIDSSRIIRFGDKDNFWQMGDTGPCGPCSEIFYDQGEENFNTPEDKMGGDGDRFLEIWNLVFMQFERDESGTLHPLPKPSIDTGMGLERVVAIKEGVLNNYHSSLFMPYIEALEKLVGKKYDYNDKQSASFRVIADHLRSVSFLLAQGVNFDKEGRGYVLRRIMRRAIRHGYLLGLREPFMYKLADVLVNNMSSHYSYLEDRLEPIKSAMKLEEERFFDTIEAGITLFNKELENTKNVFSGEVAFKLYDTFGFPLDLTEDMLRELKISLDKDEFEKHMNMQREQSKASWKGSGDAIANGDFKELKESFGINNFVGYEHKSFKSKVLALLDEDFKSTKEITTSGWVMLDNTPFYAQSGGQRGDEGTLNDTIRVTDTKKFLDINLSHIEGKVKVGDNVEAIVDDLRMQIAKHHSATHLLHAALREILGSHIAQAGSLVEENRLRFDFSHPQPLKDEELNMVEAWVNDKIDKAIPGKTNVMDIQSAKDKGAMALFGEKYGDEVRVVEFSDSSIELCGGIHVENSSQIGQFIILKESGVSAGVRRIEAICGKEAISYNKNLRVQIEEIKAELKNKDPINGIYKLKEQIKSLKQELENSLSSQKSELKIEDINGVSVVISEIDSGDIKTMIDDFKNKFDKALIMLIQPKDDKVLIACGSKGVDIKAGDWIKNIAPILGGGGGGRDDFAQAGGKEVAKIADALSVSREYIKNNL
ncbi:MAG: alanine--tRNA ligase [Sulfurovaceae bacterium]|nr:alanine--tRNA ligase [Sulfurovaceae bacterium]MDD5548066.1 alanine--tRNA ligase [Sulfurovaceae bacterium]